MVHSSASPSSLERGGPATTLSSESDLCHFTVRNEKRSSGTTVADWNDAELMSWLDHRFTSHTLHSSIAIKGERTSAIGVHSNIISKNGKVKSCNCLPRKHAPLLL